METDEAETLENRPLEAETSLSTVREAFSPEMLSQYYARLFPAKELCLWIGYGTAGREGPALAENLLRRREFSFTLKDDVYIRYLSYSNVDEFKGDLLSRCPYKIDIGAVYSHPPSEHSTISHTQFLPEQRELVFDIDMTDYDDIRTCCTGANVCDKCWVWMTLAIKVLDRALREDFGFEHILWVYSGRRGVHCWVCDERVRMLHRDAESRDPAEVRSSLAHYFEVIKGGDSMARKVNLPHPLHPSLERALRIVRPVFEGRILSEQGLLDHPQQWQKMLALIPDAATRTKLEEHWVKDPNLSPKEKWIELQEEVVEAEGPRRRRAMTVEEIILTYTYPRLDIHVTKGLNHLLKSPFCVHPKTGRVCIPIDPQDCETFDPSVVPTAGSLLGEIEEYDAVPHESSARNDVEKTSLSASLETFRRTFLRPLGDHLRRKFRDEASRDGSW